MEIEFIQWLRRRLPEQRGLEIGIGDDAAVLAMPGGDRCVLTSDLLTDQVDFELQNCDPRRVGRKALAVNLSDLAAMAAVPRAAIVSFVAPRSAGAELPMRLYEGLLPLSEEFGMALAGGDTNSWDGPLVISVTLLGLTTERGALRRGGARPGNILLATGQFGGSILGHHFDFTPRVREALDLHARYQLCAGTDVSDGLLRDLSHLTEESGCGAVVDLDAIPISDAARQLAAQQSNGRSALDHALSDGEDFELLLAVPSADAQRILQDQPLEVPVTQIGHFVEGSGLWHHTTDGKLAALEPRGWTH